MPPTTPIKVLFIGGAGRSGSTLLDRLLGQTPGLASVGEITNIWQVGFTDDFPCGCGELFSACPFWRQVIAQAFPGGQDLDLPAVKALRRRVQRGVGKLHLLSPHQGPRHRQDLRAYAGVMVRLLRAAAQVSGASVLVDSSKLPSHGLVLAAHPGVELHALHLVRDSRAVAHSWRRKKLRRQVSGSPEYLPRLSPSRSVMRYYSGNLPMHALAARLPPGRFSRLRYEDFTAAPRQTVRQILGRLDHPADDGTFLSESRALLGENHLVDGNPMRHRRGEVEIRQDRGWETRMPPRERALVHAATLPLRLLYGY